MNNLLCLWVFMIIIFFMKTSENIKELLKNMKYIVMEFYEKYQTLYNLMI